MALRILALLLLAFSSSPARAEWGSCPTRFAQLLPGRYFQTAQDRALALQQLEELNQRSVVEIFPETQQVRTGRRTVETRVRTNHGDMKRFKDHFDDLWNKRVAAGQIPSWELKEYRAWLKAQTNSEGPYPPVNAKELFDDYISDGGTMTEYFDFKFLEYLEKVKFTRPESVEAYLKTLDRSLLRHLARSVVRKAKKIGNTFYAGAAGATLLLVTAFPGELVNAALGPWIQPIKEFFTSKTKDLSTNAVEQIRDWSLFFAGGEEEYISALLALTVLAQRFEDTNFDQKPRSDAVNELEDFIKSSAGMLPRFHGLVMAQQRDFETKWNKRLDDTKESVVAVHSSFQQHRIAIDLMKASISNRNGVPSAEELARISEYTQEMEISEDYIANVLADWLFYKQARGRDRPIDPAVDRNFATVYEKYLRTMSINKLAKALNARVKAHIRQLERYSQKITGARPVAEPPRGSTPAPEPAKPEDQIKLESPVDSAPSPTGSGAAAPAPAAVPPAPAPAPAPGPTPAPRPGPPSPARN